MIATGNESFTYDLSNLLGALNWTTYVEAKKANFMQNLNTVFKEVFIEMNFDLEANISVQNERNWLLLYEQQQKKRKNSVKYP